MEVPGGESRTASLPARLYMHFCRWRGKTHAFYAERQATRPAPAAPTQGTLVARAPDRRSPPAAPTCQACEPESLACNAESVCLQRTLRVGVKTKANLE